MRKTCIILSLFAAALSYGQLATVGAAATEAAQESNGMLLPETAKGGNSDERVTVRLKLYRWSFSNKVTIPGGDGKGAHNLSEDERKRLRAEEKSTSSPELWYRTGPMGSESWKSVVMTPGKKTAAITYQGSPEMQFYKKFPPRNNLEDAYYKPIAKLMIPQGATDIYVLMFMRGQNIKFYPMNVSPEKISKEQIAIMNMTSQGIVVTLGAEKVMLKSGAYKISNAVRNQEYAKLTLFSYINNEWVQVYCNNVVAKDDTRTIVLIYDPFGRKRLNPAIEMLTL